MELYYIGGSPCSGKSTVAERLAAKCGCDYYKLDDKLFDFMALAAQAGKPASSNYFTLQPDEIWLRTPEVQCEDELRLYGEMFEYVREDMARLGTTRPVIAEGAGFLPALVKALGVDANHYFCMVPTADFQIEHYKERTFVSLVLDGCSDKELAFQNWMDRDILFGDYVWAAARKLDFGALRVDGSLGVEAVMKLLERQFLLGK